MDLKLEVVGIPVSDVDRAKIFYQEALGFRLDVDLDAEAYEKLFGFKPPGGSDFRGVQLTPPGSACSIHISRNTGVKPGSLEGLYLVTSDIEATRAELVSRGVDVSEPFHFGPAGKTPGVHPEHQDYNSYMSFRDPDGNSWLIQEIRKRLPGREWKLTRAQAMDVPSLAELLRETAEHHGHFEKTHAQHHWWDWYAPYFSARQNGHSPEESAAAADRYMKEVHHI